MFPGGGGRCTCINCNVLFNAIFRCNCINAHVSVCRIVWQAARCLPPTPQCNATIDSVTALALAFLLWAFRDNNTAAALEGFGLALLAVVQAAAPAICLPKEHLPRDPGVVEEPAEKMHMQIKRPAISRDLVCPVLTSPARTDPFHLHSRS